ncbi:MAG: NINE protein [Pyrinomonadaceae bacterium]|nr:NINE protein [Pyrinomonadaceae bacterium]
MATNYVTCPNCQSSNPGNFTTCTNCGTMLPFNQGPMQPMGGQNRPLPGADKKLAAGLCGILLGGLGIHKFILGYQQEGIIYLGMFGAALIISIITCGIGSILFLVPSVMGLIEGIIYLTKSDEEFVQTYIVNKKPWF